MARQVVAPLSKSTDRLLCLGLILIGWALLIVIRLFQLQVLAHDKYQRLGEAQQERLEPLAAPRGAIFDRNGNYLAISSPSQFVVVNPSRIPDKSMAAAILSSVLKLDARKLQADLEEAAVSRRHRGYFVVDPNVTPEKSETLRGLKLDWMGLQQGSLRTYPNGQLAAHVIGNVGAEGHGAAGVELKLEKDLAGIPGWLRVKVDVKQRPYDSEIAKAPVMGKNIGLTIDSQIQHAAEEAIKDAVVKHHGEHGSIVAMDPNTGEIFALANYPTYDPNERLHAGDATANREDLAVVAPYEPGSVFKVITVSAALETTRLRPETIIPCAGGVLRIFGRTVHDSHGHGDLSMADVLVQSSNVGAIRIGMQVGEQNLYEYVRKFGIGSRTGIELPAEAPGMLRKLSRWQPTSLPSVAFGHEVSTTTVQLARMGAVIANGGFLIYPHIVAWEQSPGGPRVMKTLPPPVPVLDPKTVMTMRGIMQRVVTDAHGTAHRLHLIGYTLAGKTGTAQIFDAVHHVYTHKYNASFLGFAPAKNPSIVVVSTVSGTTGEAGFGSAASGPAVQDVAIMALRVREVPRDVPEEIEALEQKELAAKEKLRKGRPEGETDSVAVISTPLSDEEARQALGVPESEEQPLLDLAVVGPKVPDFMGKTVQDVAQEATAAGLDVETRGEGIARAQYPLPESPLQPGVRIRVRFAR